MSKKLFERVSCAVSQWVGRPEAMWVAGLLLVSWVAAGFLWDDLPEAYGTLADAITLTLVFVMQAANNRDNLAVHVKLDEIGDHLGIPSLREHDKEGERDLNRRL